MRFAGARLFFCLSIALLPPATPPEDDITYG